MSIYGVYSTKPLVTHAAAGSAVMSSSRQCVERLLAFHTHSHLVVPDPAGGSSAKFLCLENTGMSQLGCFIVIQYFLNRLNKTYWVFYIQLLRSQFEGFIFLLKHINGFLNHLDIRQIRLALEKKNNGGHN